MLKKLQADILFVMILGCILAILITVDAIKTNNRIKNFENEIDKLKTKVMIIQSIQSDIIEDLGWKDK